MTLASHEPPLADPSRALAVVLNDLAWLLPRSIGAEAARAEPLPPTELEIMRLIARQPGLSVTDVATGLGMRSNNVSAAVRSLVERGLLLRRADDRDRRIVHLEPTAAAHAARERRELSWADELRAALEELPSAARASLAAASPALRLLADTFWQRAA